MGATAETVCLSSFYCFYCFYCFDYASSYMLHACWCSLPTCDRFVDVIGDWFSSGPDCDNSVALYNTGLLLEVRSMLEASFQFGPMLHSLEVDQVAWMSCVEALLLLDR